ncbi:hypothetical protein V6N13_031812 [Hibiscus sabdariffa]
MEQVFCFCLMSLGSKIQPQDILHTKLPAMVTSLRDDYLFLMCLNDIAVSLFQNPDLFRGDPWEKSRMKTMFEQWSANQDPQGCK